MLLQGNKLPHAISAVRDYLHSVAKSFGLTVHQFAAIKNHHFGGEVRISSTGLLDQELHCDEKCYSVFIPIGPRSFRVVRPGIGSIEELDADAGEPHP